MAPYAMHNFRKLEVWTRSRELGTEIYQLCATVSRSDAKIVGSQLRRSALSISTNIAEGCGKSSRAETVRYLEIAAGSAAETEHHLLVAIDLGLVDGGSGEALLRETRSVRRMLRV